MKPKLTPEIIHAASWDAGNRSMRAGGRTVWSLDDSNAAALESERLYRIFDGEPEPLHTRERRGVKARSARMAARNTKRGGLARALSVRGEK